MKNGRNNIKLWLLNLAEEDQTASAYVSNFVQKLRFCVYPSDSFSVTTEGLLAFELMFDTWEKWESVPVVTNVDEFKELLDEKGRLGYKSYVVRYEVEEGEPEVAPSRYNCSVSYHIYNDGKSRLITVEIEY